MLICRLLFLVLFCTLIPPFSTSKLTHHPLCTKLTSGHFTQIHLHSITYQNDNQLLIYEDGYKYLATLDTSRLQLKLSAQFTAWNESYPLQGTVASFITGNLTAVYQMNNWKRIGLNVVTTKGEYMWDLTTGSARLARADYRRTRPDYAIVHNQVGGSVHGYVINQDIYSPSSFAFVIYQLWLDQDLRLSSIHLLSTSASVRNSSRFYYLSTSSTDLNKTIFIHRSKLNSSSSNWPLFTSLPVGFLHSDHLYLFDTTRACVYVHVNFPESFDLYETFAFSSGNLEFPRINIPYETFFSCSNASTSTTTTTINRCDSIGTSPILPHPQSPSLVDAEVEQVIWTVGLVLAALVISLLVIYVVVVVVSKKKKQKHQAHFRPSVEVKRHQEAMAMKSRKMERISGNGKRPEKSIFSVEDIIPTSFTTFPSSPRASIHSTSSPYTRPKSVASLGATLEIADLINSVVDSVEHSVTCPNQMAVDRRQSDGAEMSNDEIATTEQKGHVARMLEQLTSQMEKK